MEGPNETKPSDQRSLSSRSNFHFNQRQRVGRPTRGGKRVKTVPAIKANFLSLFKSLCVHSSANFTSELVCSKEGGKDREQKGRQEFSSRSLPFTVGQRTVLKWIPIFQGVDLIKRGPDFRDGNILPGRKLRKFGARNIKAVWPKADG